MRMLLSACMKKCTVETLACIFEMHFEIMSIFRARFLLALFNTVYICRVRANVIPPSGTMAVNSLISTLQQHVWSTGSTGLRNIIVDQSSLEKVGRVGQLVYPTSAVYHLDI